MGKKLHIIELDRKSLFSIALILGKTDHTSWADKNNVSRFSLSKEINGSKKSPKIKALVDTYIVNIFEAFGLSPEVC